jgi:hypothetical protein
LGQYLLGAPKAETDVLAPKEASRVPSSREGPANERVPGGAKRGAIRAPFGGGLGPIARPVWWAPIARPVWYCGRRGQPSIEGRVRPPVEGVLVALGHARARTLGGRWGG